MANWYGSARTNYFLVRDRQAFSLALAGLPVEIVENSNGDGRVALLSTSDDGDFQSSRYDEATDDYDEVDLVEIVSAHLVDGEVAVFQVVGAEKLRYLTGWAAAVNNKGERRQVSIDDIYAAARELGTTVTEVTY